jgi:hypothetical protein
MWPARLAAFAPILLSGAAMAYADDAAVIAAAREFAAPQMASTCMVKASPDDRVYPIHYRVAGQDQDSPDLRRQIIQLQCSADAVNVGWLFVSRDDADGDMVLLSFAEPRLDYDYADESFSRLAAPPRILGYGATQQLFGARFDPATLTLTSFHKWRPAGDAWSRGRWILMDGMSILGQFEVDPTFGPEANIGRNKVVPSSYSIFDAKVP